MSNTNRNTKPEEEINLGYVKKLQQVEVLRKENLQGYVLRKKEQQNKTEDMTENTIFHKSKILLKKAIFNRYWVRIER